MIQHILFHFIESIQTHGFFLSVQWRLLTGKNAAPPIYMFGIISVFERLYMVF